MPKLHKYKRENGYFIKGKVKNSIVTYQLTDKGEQILISKGYQDEDDIHRDDFHNLHGSGDIYTNGGGVSDEIDLGDFPIRVIDEDKRKSANEELKLRMEETQKILKGWNDERAIKYNMKKIDQKVISETSKQNLQIKSKYYTQTSKILFGLIAIIIIYFLIKTFWKI